MTEKDAEINVKTALKNTGIVVDLEGRFNYKEDLATNAPPPIPEGGYTMELLFNKMCSIETTIVNNHRENQFEHALLRRQMRELIKAQRNQAIVNDKEDDEEVGDGDGQEEDDEDMDE